MLKECIVILAIFGFVFTTDMVIDKNTSDCGKTITIYAGEEYIVKSMGEDPGINCTYTFKGDLKDNCMGLCFALQPGSFFKDMKVTLKVVLGSNTMRYHYRYVTMAPWCSEDVDMTVTLSVDDRYMFDPKNRGYQASLAVYNRCGPSGSKSITFEEAIENIETYHHGEKFDDNVHKNMVHGILVGVCLALVFLVILFVTYCYYKQSPNRGRSRSTSGPKLGGFNKKMDVEKDSRKRGAEPDPEAHFTYKKTDPEKVHHEPEGKPLLSGADPEKPPAEAKFDPSVDTAQ